jgi:hypothetical protein
VLHTQDAVGQTEVAVPRFTTPLWVVVRWIAVMPAALVVMVIGGFLFPLIFSIGGELVSGLAGVFGTAVSAGYAVASAAYVAPAFKRYAAVAVACYFCLLAMYYIAIELTHAIPAGDHPVWLQVVANVAFGMGSIIGVFAALDMADEPTQWPPQLPAVLRWLLFLPCALAARALVVIIPLLLFHGSENYDPVDLWIRFMEALVFVSLATAIAPRGRKVVVSVLSALWIVSGGLYMVGGIFRPLLLAFFALHVHRDVEFLAPAWLESLQGAAWLSGGLIPALATFHATAKHQT